MPKYLIGIDVGGTNTDSVLLDPTSSGCVLAWNKQLTSPNVSRGIKDSIEQLFDEEKSKKDVLSVTIGTTHFINAIIERDSARLQKVAVLRICGPYSRDVPPFSNFPADLKTLLEGYVGFLEGGYHVDGNEIGELDEDEIRGKAKEIKQAGLTAIAISGVFSPVFPDQEERVASILKEELPECIIVTSHSLSGIGILERENLAILNAAVMRFANNTINTFAHAVQSTGINAPILLTQNDGTVLTIAEALNTPIKTFSSGTTNSMRGAAFLVQNSGEHLDENIIVVDVGGTTTDVGLLLKNGYPRKTSSFSFIGGVKTRLAMPQVESIGLGGGSIVRVLDGKVTVGPDSVGNDFSKSLVGGGDVLTASDIAVWKELQGTAVENPVYAIGDKERVRGHVNRELVPDYSKTVLHMLEKVVDRMKTSPEDIPVLLVGGGSFILPDEIKGASKVWRPEYFQVANAIGAAIGKISAVAQSFGKLDDKDSIVEKLKAEASEKAEKNGAKKESISVVDITSEELPYVNMHKFEVKVVSDVDYEKLKSLEQAYEPSAALDGFVEETITKHALRTTAEEDIDAETYKPSVKNKEWCLSATDLEFIRIGTYILGCGGGGDPYPQYLIARNLIAQGHKITVVDPEDIDDNNESIFVGFVGSPTVAGERIQGAEVTTAYRLLNPGNIETVVSLEIGGGNGFQGLLLGAQLSKKVIDCDLMGRAYPMIWQITPNVLSDRPCFSPCAFSDGNGNDVFVTRTKNNKAAESLIRAALSELGIYVGLVSAVDNIQSMVIKNSVSLAWRIGRAVAIAKQKSSISNVAEYIIDSVKPTSAKKIFEGKIVGVEKKLHKGYVFGEVVIESSSQTMRIPFQNENLLARVDDKVVASVPDLICVLDSETGEAIGTPDYKYGLVVTVLGIAPSDHWTSEKGLEVGGPAAFGFDDVVYESVGTYAKTVGVIEEYGA